MASFAVMCWALGAAGCSGSPAPDQPLPFSHAVHAGAQAIACTDCHAGAKQRAEAGLPALRDCLRCHMRPQGTSPQEPLVRQRAAAGGEFRWIQVTRNAGHVYFSHRAHTQFAAMACEDCHGQVWTWAEPPRWPNPRLLDMGACMSCHRKQGASNECRTCHR